MITFRRMIIKDFIPVFLISVVLFALILELLDLFANLPRYISLETAILDMLRVGAYYFPKCISFSVPVGFLFAISFTLGNLYSTNQLIAIFGSGVSLYRFVLPFIVIGLLLSFGNLYFEESLVIDTFSKKNSLQAELLKQHKALSSANVAVLSADNKALYIADYYNDNARTLSGVTVLTLENSIITSRIEAERAEWKEGQWILRNARLFSVDLENLSVRETFHSQLADDKLSENPSSFQKMTRNMAEMKKDEAIQWLESVKRAGTALYSEALTDYYRRFAYAATPLIVSFIAASLGGIFRKNILLMSLLTSLCISVVYYVMEMVTVLLAKQGVFTPLTGAVFPGIVFLILGVLLFRLAPS